MTPFQTQTRGDRQVPPESGSDTARTGDIRSLADRIAGELAAAFAEMLAALPDRPVRAMDVARSLGVNKNLTHRISTALGASDPLTGLLAMPGPLPLARVAELARKKGVPPELCRRALRAVREFDDLIRSVAGDRTSFDAMVSAWVPASRAQIDTAARQSVYRGMRQILGVAGDTQFNVYCFHPNAEDRDRVDLFVVQGQMGVQRLKTDGRLCMTVHSRLEDLSAFSDSTRGLLTDFCSSPTPEFALVGSQQSAAYELQWNDRVGRASTRDLVIGELHRKAFRERRADPLRPFGGVAVSLDVPVRRFVADVLFHRDVYRGSVPTFRVLTTGLKGYADPNDLVRAHDCIDVHAEMQVIPEGHAHLATTPEVPSYGRLLQAQAAALGWDITEFRAFRVRFDYPIFDSQMQWLIPLSEPDAEA